MTIERTIYERGWVKCADCGTTRPPHLLSDGWCADGWCLRVPGVHLSAVKKAMARARQMRAATRQAEARHG